jgi:hypothetical protein
VVLKRAGADLEAAGSLFSQPGHRGAAGSESIMFKLLQSAAPIIGAALITGLTTTAAHAAPPTRSEDHLTDVVACGDPENPDFVLAYTADLYGQRWPRADRGNTDAAAGRSRGLVVETYSIAGHNLVSTMLENSHDQTVTVAGDRLIVTVYSSGTSTWSLDGQVIARSSGTLRITYSADHNDTPDDRSDDFDYVIGDASAPGSGHNTGDVPDPCAVLAPFGS